MTRCLRPSPSWPNRHEVPARIAERFGGSLDRLQFYAGVRDAERWGPIIEEIKAA